jgi:MYXO-CTERM domain-containing protein
MRSVTKVRSLVRLSFALSLLVVASLARNAEAHFDLLMPPSADTDVGTTTAAGGGKGDPPCGPTSASGIVTPVMGGHPVLLSVRETVFHPGHYRIALATSRAGLPADPIAVVDANGNSVSAPIQNPAVFPILADGVYTHTAPQPQPFAPVSIMLPNITCAKCTLQVIEFMAMHGANIGGGFYYHHCADLAITADPALPADGGVADAGGTDARTDSGSDVHPGTGGSNGGAAGAGGGGGRTGTGGTTGGVAGASGGGVGGATGLGGQTGGGTTGLGGAVVDAGILPITSDSSGCSCSVARRDGFTTIGTGMLVIATLLRRRRRR